MRVFKFGGASVKDAEAIKNVADILRLYPTSQLLVVVSAMGKTTNLLEIVAKSIWDQNQEDFQKAIQQLEDFHQDIISKLFNESKQIKKVVEIIENLKSKYSKAKSDNFSYEYDQIVSLGEVLSTVILCDYLEKENLEVYWCDARKVVRTDRNYREGNIDWKKTAENVKNLIIPVYREKKIVVTQGFIGYTPEGFTTTLGREGSDYTAAIFAYCLDAENVTIWKDVPGMLNADPKYFDNTVKLDQISFQEAIELSYYGASVIHPKTVKPLQNKNIPLYVKSFLNPEAEGTVIQEFTELDSLIPSFIFKMNQLLISITTRDFSFIVEEHLSDIFKRLAKLQITMNVMQNSALSFRILVDNEKVDLEKFRKLFQDDYTVKFTEHLELVTIRHYDQATIDRVTVDKKVILEQKTTDTARLLLENI